MMERTYVMCGFDNKDNICISYIRYNEDTDEIEEQRYYGFCSDQILAIYPPMFQDKSEEPKQYDCGLFKCGIAGT